MGNKLSANKHKISITGDSGITDIGKAPLLYDKDITITAEESG